MTITTEQAVALAEKHGASSCQLLDAKIFDCRTGYRLWPEEITAMLNDHEQQVLEKAEAHNEKMRIRCLGLERANGAMADRNDKLQALVEKRDAEIESLQLMGQELAEKLGQAEARVEQLEKALCTARQYTNWMDHDDVEIIVRALLGDAAMNKESGK